MLHPPTALCCTPPSVGATSGVTPTVTLTVTPDGSRRPAYTRTPHVTASGLMSRSVLQVVERSIAPCRVSGAEMPAGSL